MGRQEVPTFYLYAVGRSPEFLSLGTLILGHYSNIEGRRSIQATLSDAELQEWAWSTSMEECDIDLSSSPKLGFSIDGADVASISTNWTTTNGVHLVSPSGSRTQLKEPQEFLNQIVLGKNNKARDNLQLWISSSRSDYMMKLKWLRSPKVWMLTGQYILNNASAVQIESRSTGGSAAISSSLVGTLTGLPIGGSVDLGHEKKAVVKAKWTDSLVWAAQYQLLDIDYTIATQNQAIRPPPNVVPLADVVSNGTLRGGKTDSNAFILNVRALESSNPPEDETSEETQIYDSTLEQSIAELAQFIE
ncbi:hypothetical protein K461DRAFT_324871 [Myriangium duriaei CBS 260.36]|uniref:Uncharacterized protein n=1 Tax=Myriangium duriaei CBS 260.36 TaxID=1168546 RepID=A0A9P4MCB6_9PEZI|nr:hypothetical protein K461DRAFT_324871 [Myriangium duriaei CBS 260.36]